VTLDMSTRIPVAPALLEIQAPVRDRLDRVPDEMWRIVQADVAIVEAAKSSCGWATWSPCASSRTRRMR
jgi:hypothetical protein